MKKQSLFISGYAALLLIGGLIGYLVAGSMASLLVSALFAAIFLICSFFIQYGNRLAYDVTIAATGCLLLFFGYRFAMSFKIAPAGIMLVASGALLFYLIKQRRAPESA